jgi:hypothetical protein
MVQSNPPSTSTSQQGRFRYLVRAELKPGDVVLVRSVGWESTLIARASGGDYSHAALVCEDNELFEADDEGAGFTHLSDVLAKVNESCVSWARLRHDCDRLIVLRHPQLSSRYPDGGGPAGLLVKEAVRKAAQSYFGGPYSKMERLAEASRLPEALAGLRPLLAWLLRVGTETRDINSPLPGVFCSELVALVFQKELGLPLFAEDRPPVTISPNDLTPDKSLLVAVPGAVVSPSLAGAAQVHDSAAALNLPTLRREDLLPTIVSIKEGLASWQQTFEQSMGPIVDLITKYPDQSPELKRLGEDLMQWGAKVALERTYAYALVRLPMRSDQSRRQFEEFRSMEAWHCARQPAVIERALAAPQVQEAQCLRGVSDPADWLAHHLEVSFPGSPDVMRLEVRGAPPREVLALADAVADAYLADARERWERKAQERIDMRRSAEEHVQAILARARETSRQTPPADVPAGHKNDEPAETGAPRLPDWVREEVVAEALAHVEQLDKPLPLPEKLQPAILGGPEGVP